MAGNDFVMVQLSKDGEAFAKDGPLSISNGRRSFTFKAGVPQRVERSYEWLAVLSRHVSPAGKRLFELVPTATPVAVPAAPATPVQAQPPAAAAIVPKVPAAPVAEVEEKK